MKTLPLLVSLTLVAIGALAVYLRSSRSSVAAPATAPSTQPAAAERWPDWTPLSDDQIREKLTPEQYRVTRQAGTEPAFSGKHWDQHADGVYHCVVCDLPLFSSKAKFDSGTGWPSYWQPIDPAHVIERDDRSHGMVRTEVICARCESHLGHVFPDGPKPTGLRYCMNSAALQFKSADASGK